jgi:outer membrane protein assembly factor BamB
VRGRPVLLVALLCCAVMLPGARAADIDAPRIEVRPDRAVLGGSVVVVGSGFPAGALVDVFLDRTDRALVVVDDAGALSARLTIPLASGPGRHWVTLSARRSGIAAQVGFEAIAPASDWPQVGNDPGRRGAAVAEEVLTPATVGDLDQSWWKDLEVLGPREGIFVTDSAGEIAEPIAVVGEHLVATWFGDVVGDGKTGSRTALAVLDLSSGEIQWRRVADSSGTRWGATHPVVVGDTLITRWWNDTVLLGLDLATGDERWRRSLPGDEHFEEPLAVGGQVLIAVDRDAAGKDRLLVLDGSTGVGDERSLPRGSDWRLVATPNLIVAVGAGWTYDFAWVLGIDPVSLATRWSQMDEYSWGPVLATATSVVVPRVGGGMDALRLRDGQLLWTWQPWPGGCGPDCGEIRSEPGAAIGATLVVRAHALACGSEDPAADALECPYRGRTVALDVATGEEGWVLDGSFGAQAATEELVISGATIDDLTDGRVLLAFDPPVHPNTYGAQQHWYGQPIIVSGRVVMGAADGTITVFEVVKDHAKPRVSALIPDPLLRPPPPYASPAPPPTAPAPSAATDRSAWIFRAVAAVFAALLLGGLLLRRGGRPGRHVSHPGPA